MISTSQASPELADGVGTPPRPGPARRMRPRPPGSRAIVLAAWFLASAVLVYYPLMLLFRLGLRTEDGGIGLGNYQSLLTEPDLLTAAWNSTWTAAATTAVCVAVGVPLAFLVSRTDLPFKALIKVTSVMTFALPSFIAATAWILLFAPRSGIVNVFVQGIIGTSHGPINIFTPWGIVFALSVFSYPLVFLPTAAALDNMEPNLEQAAASVGAKRWTVFRRVTFPLVLPATFAGGLLVFTTSFIAYGPVAMLGRPAGFENVPTAMLRLMQMPPRIEMAAVMAVPTLFVLAALLLIQNRAFRNRDFSIVSGKPGQRSLIRLGPWRWPAAAVAICVFVVTVLMPAGVLLFTSIRKSLGRPFDADNFAGVDNYLRVFDQARVVEATQNSLVLALAAAVLGAVVALLGAWLVERGSSRLTSVVAPTMLAALAFPGAVLGISLVIAYGGPPLSLNGSLTILLLAYVISNLPLAFVYLRAGLKQVHPSMEESARSLGASWFTTVRRVTIPLLSGPLAVVMLVTFVLQFRDLDSSVFLYAGSNPVIAVVLINLAESSLFQLMSAFSVLIFLANLSLVGVAGLILRFRGRARNRRRRSMLTEAANRP